MSEKNGTDKGNFTSQCRTPIFLLNATTLILMMVVLGMVVLYLFEGRAQNEDAIQLGIDANKTQDETKKQSMENGKNIEIMNRTLINFINARNVAFNVTFAKLTELATQNEDVLQQQLQNEKNIIGNLTDHRLVANFTRDQIISLENQTTSILKQTNALLEGFNQTNESERGKAVASLHEDHQNIIGILNKTQ